MFQYILGITAIFLYQAGSEASGNTVCFQANSNVIHFFFFAERIRYIRQFLSANALYFQETLWFFLQYLHSSTAKGFDDAMCQRRSYPLDSPRCQESLHPFLRIGNQAFPASCLILSAIPAVLCPASLDLQPVTYQRLTTISRHGNDRIIIFAAQSEYEIIRIGCFKQNAFYDAL